MMSVIMLWAEWLSKISPYILLTEPAETSAFFSPAYFIYTFSRAACRTPQHG
jgi:hypothetical protein